MTTAPNALATSALLTAFAPRVALIRHAAPASWGATARQDLARKLRALGTTITELSDARELLGFLRLSEASDWDREHAAENVEAPAMIFALAEVRRERAELLAGMKSVDWKARRQAHKLLDLQGERDLRLGELQALYRQAVICELAALGAPVEALVEAEYLAGVAL